MSWITVGTGQWLGERACDSNAEFADMCSTSIAKNMMLMKRIGEIETIYYALIFTGVGGFLYAGISHPLPWILMIAGVVLRFAKKSDDEAGA